MSGNLTKARQKLNSIPSLLKQNKVLAATQAFYESIVTFLKEPLMNNEKKEFSELIEKNLYYLNQNPKLREVYPILIEYKPGEEKKLLKAFKEILEMLQEGITEVAKEQLVLLEQRKKQEMSKAKEYLKEKKVKEAENIYDKLVKKFEGDTQLKIEISDQLIEAEVYEPSLKYLKMAYREDPSSIHVFNRLGITLRKLKRFEDAKKAYEHALKINPQDEYLYFNLARVYFDQGDLKKAKETIEKCLKLNPNFEVAQKMLSFIEKKLT